MFSQFIKQTNILTLLAIIFILGDVFPEGTVIAAQSLIVEICELWFYQERDKRESVVLHSILFLMIKANQVNAQLSDLKRLFEFRDAFTLIDLDENNETIIDLIQRSAINSLFLAHDVGKKFLIFLLTTHPNIIDQIHVAIKSVLVQAQPWKVAVYAHIYFQVTFNRSIAFSFLL